MVKNPPDNAGDIRHPGSIPGSGRPPGGGNGNTLQCSCLENPVDGGAWQGTVHRFTKRRLDKTDGWIKQTSQFPSPRRGVMISVWQNYGDEQIT